MPTKSSKRPRIRIVSICKDNPDDLLVTSRSVEGQTCPPDTYVVVDSSGSQHQPRMEELSAQSGANYMWVEPRGIYNAMLDGIRGAADDDYVWFVNATDWLASRDAIRSVISAIEIGQRTKAPVWLIGRTAIAGGVPHLLRFAQSGVEFVEDLRAGKLGLPHSSTIVTAGAMRGVDAFAGPYRISRDYEMALKLAERFGPPALVDSVLSVYDEGGESARNAVRNALHKAEARMSNQPKWQVVLEPFRIGRSARREILRRSLAGNPENQRLRDRLGWMDFEGNGLFHFCDGGGSWPECCLTALLHTD